MSDALFHGRRAATLALYAAQSVLPWGLAAVLTLPVLSPLARHPDGAFALYTEGGRVLGDVLRAQSSGVSVALGVAALVGALWWAAWVVLGATLPVLGVVEPAPSLHRAMSYSLRRAPTLVALSLLALLGYGVAAVACGLASPGPLHALVRGETPATIAPRDLHGLAAGGVGGALVTVWHDAARVVAVGRGAGAGSAAVAAVAWIAREPGATLGAALMHAVAGYAGVALAYGASLVWGGHSASAAVLALVATEQVALAWRFGWRARWFFHLGARFRERARPSEAAPPQEP
jgi:hypothetical protein